MSFQRMCSEGAKWKFESLWFDIDDIEQAMDLTSWLITELMEQFQFKLNGDYKLSGVMMTQSHDDMK